MKKKNVLRWSLLIGWMIFIFMMSAQNGEESSSQSNLVLQLFSFIGINLSDSFGEIATLIIRKAAHFTEYCILYILFYNVIILYKNSRQAIILSILGTFLYACSDEFHQAFVPGRGPAFTDVMIDTSGGVFGIVLIKIYGKIRKSSEK